MHTHYRSFDPPFSDIGIIRVKLAVVIWPILYENPAQRIIDVCQSRVACIVLPLIALCQACQGRRLSRTHLVRRGENVRNLLVKTSIRRNRKKKKKKSDLKESKSGTRSPPNKFADGREAAIAIE